MESSVARNNGHCSFDKGEWRDIKNVLEAHAESVKMLNTNMSNIGRDLIESRAAIAATVGNAIKMSVILVLSVEALFGVVILILVLKDDLKSFKAGSTGLEITAQGNS